VTTAFIGGAGCRLYAVRPDSTTTLVALPPASTPIKRPARRPAGDEKPAKLAKAGSDDTEGNGA
jgi:hypothetical protein